MQKPTIAVLPITKNDIARAAETLYHAFLDDPVYQWLFISKENYQKNGRLMFGLWIKYCVLYGTALRTQHFESIALLRKPGDQVSSLWRRLRSGMIPYAAKLGRKSTMRLIQMNALSIKAQSQDIGHQPYWNCWLFGTHPTHQGKGFFSALTHHLYQMTDNKLLPSYLRATTEQARKVYSHKGYQSLSQYTLPDTDITITCMANNTHP